MRKLSSDMVKSWESSINTADRVSIVLYINQLKKEIDDYEMYKIGEKEKIYWTLMDAAKARYKELHGKDYEPYRTLSEIEDEMAGKPRMFR